MTDTIIDVNGKLRDLWGAQVWSAYVDHGTNVLRIGFVDRRVLTVQLAAGEAFAVMRADKVPS